MKMFKGKISFDMVVVAEDEEEAMRIISRNVRDEVDNGHDVTIKRVCFKKDLPHDWSELAVPYGGDQETTCEQWLEENA